jgi:hypothetical protein
MRAIRKTVTMMCSWLAICLFLLGAVQLSDRPTVHQSLFSTSNCQTKYRRLTNILELLNKYAFNIKQIRKYRYLKIKYEIYLQFYRILIMIFRIWNYLQFILYASPIFKIKIKHKISDKYFSPTSGKSKRKSHRQISSIAKATRSCPSGSTNVAFLLLTSELGPILAVYL